jgi:Kef-type K+ transport system membrane component KefB
LIRAIIVLCLVAGITFAARSFLPSDATITGSGAALAFGFLLLAALQTGHVFHVLRLPHLTGFLLCGAIFGPQVLDLITAPMLKDLGLVKNVAVGLIALTAGCELNFRTLRPRIKSIGAISALGLLFSGVFLFSATFLAARYLSDFPGLAFLASKTVAQQAVISLVITNVLIALSPAVVMGILSESRAQGPLSELCLSIVVLADLVVAISFSFSDSAVRAAFPDLGGHSSVFGALAVHILGSMAVGAFVGLVFALYIQRVALRIGLFVFAVCFVVAEAGTSLHLDPLLVGLSAGLFLENVSPVSGHEVIQQTEVAAMPVFAVFFAVIGAEVHLDAFLAVAPFAIAAAAVRASGITLGARLGGRLAGVNPAIVRRVPFGMFPQAGIALALAGLVKRSFPPWGEAASTLLLGTIVVNESVGPVLFRLALSRAGEIGKRPGNKNSHASIPDRAHHAANAVAATEPQRSG